MNAIQSTRSSDVARRQGARAALCTLAGIVASGPLTWIVFGILGPQPAWQSSAVFAAHFQPVQSLPYVAGFLLVAGYVGLIASLHALADPEQKPAAFGRSSSRSSNVPQVTKS
jgi:hypothetical protein